MAQFLVDSALGGDATGLLLGRGGKKKKSGGSFSALG